MREEEEDNQQRIEIMIMSAVVSIPPRDVRAVQEQGIMQDAGSRRGHSSPFRRK